MSLPLQSMAGNRSNAAQASNSLNSQFDYAVIAITIASIVDTMDGRIARLIKGTSKFGAELDSLIDFINFGVAPAITVYIWILKDLGIFIFGIKTGRAV